MAARLAPWTRRLRRARACSEVALVRARHADPLVDPGAVERLGRRDCPSPSGQDWSRLRARGATTWSPAHFFLIRPNRSNSRCSKFRHSEGRAKFVLPSEAREGVACPPASAERSRTVKVTEIDLSTMLKFSPDTGRLLLGSDRMLLFRQEAFATLRKLMIEQLGEKVSRGLLAQFGHRCGIGDHEALIKQYAWDSELDEMSAGPVMHMLGGDRSRPADPARIRSPDRRVSHAR